MSQIPKLKLNRKRSQPYQNLEPINSPKKVRLMEKLQVAGKCYYCLNFSNDAVFNEGEMIEKNP